MEESGAIGRRESLSLAKQHRRLPKQHCGLSCRRCHLYALPSDADDSMIRVGFRNLSTHGFQVAKSILPRRFTELAIQFDYPSERS